MKASELFRKYPKTSDFDHSNYRLFERIPAVPGTSNNRGLTVDIRGQVWLGAEFVGAELVRGRVGQGPRCPVTSISATNLNGPHTMVVDARIGFYH